MDSEKTFLQIVSYLKKYAKQHKFQKAILGLSGGIDSAVCACIAKEAFGQENVLALFMQTSLLLPIILRIQNSSKKFRHRL